MNLVSERAPKKYLFCKKDNEVMRVSGLLFWENGSFSEPSLTPNTCDELIEREDSVIRVFLKRKKEIEESE